MGRITTPSTGLGPRCTRSARTRALGAAVVALVVATVLLGGGLLDGGLLGGAASAQEPAGPAPTPSDPGRVLVINVSGLLDPVLVNFIEQSVADAEAVRAKAVVLQVNSEGAVVSDERFTELARVLVESSVPVDAWVGPSGAKALGAAAELVGITEVRGMAPGTRLGDMGPQRLPVDEFGVVYGAEAAAIADQTVGVTEAEELGLISSFPPVVVERDGESVEIPGAPVIGDFLVNLDGVVSEQITVGDQVRRQPVTTILFSRLSLLDQLAHTVASPEVAYLLLVLGLGLLVFELYTAGIGIAGGVGAVCVVLASYGLMVLPTNWWAVALIGLAFFGFAIDVQTGVPRVWTIIGLLCFVVATFGLYDGLSMSWVTVLVAVVGVLVAFTAGMPAMVRTRFSTPTIGRDWMIGEMGEAVVEVAPVGVVRVREALWRAETNRATPIDVGQPIRVVGIEGLLLEVEPEEGGARDYRERG